MFTRRIATAAVLLVLFGAGCASHGTNVAAGSDAAVTPAGTPVVSSTTTASTVPTTVPPDTAPDPAPDTPVVNAAPTPASIEVDYQPQDGASATATIDGPNGLHSKSLDSGAALFRSLPAGTYSVTITVDTPSGDPSIGDARVIINGGQVDVAAGDQGVLSCDDNGCQ